MRAAFVSGSALAAALLCAAPGAALAATVEVSEEVGQDLVYRAAAGEVNDVRIRVEGGGPDPWHIFVWATVTDMTPIAAGSGCTRPDPDDAHTVRCGFRLGDSQAVIRLGDRSDVASFSSNVGMGAIFSGGSGDDVMSGGDGEDVFDEGRGPNGSDTMLGGLDLDTLFPIRDVVRYRWRGQPVRADLAGDRDDGERGERDMIGADVESLAGGRGDDRLTGNNASNRLDGGSGTDVIAGRGGSDTLFAGKDLDRTRDRLNGGPGSDQLVGGDGPNVVVGGSAADVMYPRDGRDRVWARDGAVDQVVCGKGADATGNDPFDFLIRCERSAPASESPAVPLWLNVFQDSTGRTSADVLVGCLELPMARACEGTVEVELGGNPVSDEARFTSISGHRQLVQAVLARGLEPGEALDLVVRIRSRTATGAPTDDAFPAAVLLFGSPFP